MYPSVQVIEKPGIWCTRKTGLPVDPTQPQHPQQPPTFPGQPTPAAQSRSITIAGRTFTLPWIIGGVVILLLVLTCGCCGTITLASNLGQRTTTTATATAASTTASRITPVPAKATATHGPTATPTPSYAHFGDGTFQVGKEIQPGTYRTRTGSSGCYYARLKGFGGSVDDIIANNNTDAPAVVTIAASDKGFQSQDCGTWTKNLSQVTTSKTPFGDGMYIVGTDIAPGTYKNTGVQGCYYARLSGFGNTTDDIIANNNVDTVTIVTISASDKGFESDRCGTWTKQ